MKITKPKLFIGALAALIIVSAPITVSVHKNAVRAQDVAQSTPTQPLAKPTISETPVTAIPQDTSSNTTTAPAPVKPTGIHAIGEGGTPIPEVQTTQPAKPWVRSDGYFNYCYKMDDGSWTTVIGQLTLGKGIYYYGGDIDPATQAPAYAAESQQWCAANVPAEAQ